MAGPSSAPFDVLSSEWFASLDEDDRQTSVRAAVAGESTELDLSRSRMTHIPEGVFSTLTVLTTLHLGGCTSLTALPESLGQLRALTTLNLGNCTSLAALPESIGQLRALTTLNLRYCTSLTALPESIGQLRALTKLNLSYCRSLAAESIKRGERLRKRNQRIRDGRPQRFPMATHAFAASVLFGSMIRERPCATGAGNGDGGGGTVAAVEVVVPAGSEGEGGARPHPLLRSLGAFPDCILSKLNSHGPHHASFMKKRIADYCGVAYKEAFDEWVEEIALSLD